MPAQNKMDQNVLGMYIQGICCLFSQSQNLALYVTSQGASMQQDYSLLESRDPSTKDLHKS